MMHLRNGNLCTIHDTVLRAKKRICGCEGCFFENSFFLCPGILDSKSKTKKLDCVSDRIILQKV